MLTDVLTESSSKVAFEHLKAEARLLHCLRRIPLQREGWDAWRHDLRSRIWERLGTQPDPTLPLDMRVCGEIRRPGYRVQNLVYQSRPGFDVTASLYLPDGPGPFPGVLNVHGHWQQGRLNATVQARGHVLALSGYVCLSVDAFGAGERATKHGEFEYHGAHLGAALFDVGETLMGMQLVDNMRGIDLLQSLPEVDGTRIGVTGASGGGNQTMWLAAMDDRVRTAVPVVSVGTFESYVGNANCVCEVLPDGLALTEEGGVLALIAPRALLICSSNSDSPSFCPAEMLRSFDAARQAYRMLGSEGRIANRIFRKGHGYWPEIREAMLGWFDRWLKDSGDGAPRPEPAFVP
ncbi:MAG: acetylxylan esterase, partial [Kiritimatiellae bacterium]|nr:acetylxylan esterase [Kiritimatiellia bacterium]